MGDFVGIGTKVRSVRGKGYLGILEDYFSAWNEFSQVHFSVGHGLGADGFSATTSGFQAVKMYYGNAFEMFASFVDLLTMINNVLAGRSYDQLETISLAKYLTLDKANRFDAFAATPELIDLCAEQDNRLRNASHHREMSYDAKTGIITYQPGRGGSGQTLTMTYAEYLARCSRMHHQIIVLLRLEMFMCAMIEIPGPV